MKNILFLLIGLSVSYAASAERHDVYIQDNDPVRVNNAPLVTTPVINADELGESYKQGRKIRRAWETRKARKKHEKAMIELGELDLNDKNAVLNFAQKYPEEIDSLKKVIDLNRQLN